MSKLSIALMAISMLLGSVSLCGENIFQKADSYTEVLDRAKTNRRLLLTYAASPSTPCCIAMEKATFQNPEIKLSLQQSFYPIKINLSNDLGKEWARKFNIVNSPTLLFFDVQGTLIKQVENGVSSLELKSILEDVVFYNINGYWPIDEHPVILTATVPNQTTLASNAKIPQIIACPVYESQSKVAPIFKILLDQVPTADSSIKGKVEKAKIDYPDYPVSIKLVREDQNSYFQVLIGEFKENEEAQAFLETLKTTGYEDAEIFNMAKKTP